MYALIRAGGQQHRVCENDQIRTMRLPLEVGATFETAEVLLVERDGVVRVGTPYVSGATVTGRVLAHGKGKKIAGFKYKAKKNYRRRWGSRPHYTLVQIDKITVNGEQEGEV